jgi:hypothetical protein
MCLPLELVYVQFSTMKVHNTHSSAAWCAMKQSVSLTPVWQRYKSHSPQYHIVSLLSGGRHVWEQYQQRCLLVAAMGSGLGLLVVGVGGQLELLLVLHASCCCNPLSSLSPTRDERL